MKTMKRRLLPVLAGAAGLLFLSLPLRGQDRNAGAENPGPIPAVMTLADAVEMALGSHPGVGQALAAEDAAGARVDQARSSRLPTLASQISLSRHQEPMVVAPLHGFDPTSPPAFDRNLAQGFLTLGYTLYDGGSRGAKIRGAEAGERMAEVATREAGMGITARVSEAYLGVLSGQEVLDAALAQKRALEAEEERVRLLLREGKAAQIDLLRVQAALSRVGAQEISAASALTLARGRLARLTGLDEGAIEGAVLSSVQAPAAPNPETVLARAREGNSRILQAREGVVAARSLRAQARAAWLPSVEATGRLSNYGTLEGDHVQEWQGALQLSYPLFTGGARGSEGERAKAEERRAQETLRLAELEVEEAVEEAWAALDEARALRSAFTVAVEQAEEVARIEALALEAGAGVQTDFLRAQGELFQARASLSRARHGEILAHLGLARVRGELSLEWIQENVGMER